MSTLTSKERNNLLVFGYVREQTLNIQPIPIALIKIFELYSDRTINIYWKIEGAKYNDNVRTVDGPQFDVENIKFQLQLNVQYDSFGLKMDINALPLNILSFDIKVTVNCNVFNNGNKRKYQLHFDENTRDSKRFGPRFDVKNYCMMDTNFIFEILNIKYNEIRTNYILKWKSNKSEMKLFKERETISKKYNHCMIEVTPCHFNSRSHDILFNIKLLNVSSRFIKYFIAKCHLKIESNSKNKRKQKINLETIEFNKSNIKYNIKSREGMIFRCSRSKFSNAKNIYISLDININQFYDKNGKKLDMNVLKEYGFIIN